MTDETEGEACPDNVVHLGPPVHQCASCAATIRDDDRWNGHTDRCMQPEIRLRRLEQHQADSHAALLELTEHVRRIMGAGKALVEKVEALEARSKRHGETGKPTIERLVYCSGCGGSYRRGGHDHHECQLRTFYAGSVGFPATHDPGEAQPDASAAEPEREAPAGPVHPGEEPQRAEGPEASAGGAPEGCDREPVGYGCSGGD